MTRIMRVIPTPRWRIIPTPRPWWSLHTNSRYSVNDAMAPVQEIVKKVSDLGQPALAITDHGNMAASVELYQACRKAGIAPFPGSELYVVPSTAQYRADRANKQIKAQMFHLGVVAYTTEGYENLVHLSTATHKNHFHKPLADYAMFAQMSEDGRTKGLAVTTGCYYGYLAQTLLHHGEEPAMQYLYTLASWFDPVYVEIQNHQITHDEGSDDDELADALCGLADRAGLPVAITQDSHYLNPEDRDDHNGLKRLVAFGPDPDDAVFPGDGFHVCDAGWIADRHGEHRLARGLEGLADLLGRHTLTIPVLDSYSYSVPEVVESPLTAMIDRVKAALEGHFAPKQVPVKYDQRLIDEVEVIMASEMAGYMMLAAQVTDWLRANDVMFQTRGSAAGSLVCWMLGISSVDPIKWDLRFERFLSKDRTKPPDIDLDVAHDRRDELIEMLDTRFTAHQIGSWATYSLNDTEDEFGETQRGSLRVRYFTAAGKKDEGPTSWAEVPAADKSMLASLSERHLYKGMGTNAAGIVLTSTQTEFERIVPMAWMSRAGNAGGFVTQYSKDQIEALGLVKLDALGLKTMTVLDRTMRLLDLPITRIGDIEYRDGPTYQLIRSGFTDGLFQLEGKATMRGLRDLKPTTIKDVIAAMALFRPATMNTGATSAFIARKHNQAALPMRHELIMKVTKDTNGIMLYQEQVIDLLRALGMGADDLTAFLKAVKASNKDIGEAGEVIDSYMIWVIEECAERGMSQVDIDYLTDAIAGFAEYGFNRAHATVYGITAYRCAYLAARHPLEFHTALLGVASGGESKKENRYLRTTRRRGIKVIQPEINASGATYTIDERRQAVRKGLQSVDGVGAISAERLASAQPFSDLDDLVRKAADLGVSGFKEYDGSGQSLVGILGKLYTTGCLTTLIHGRNVHEMRSDGVDPQHQ